MEQKTQLGERNAMVPLNEIKVVFLGDGGAGKSHTIARLMNDGGEPDRAASDGHATPGIVIRNKEYDLGDRTIRVHYWDFGGQEILHSLHPIFFTGRTMYVILLNTRDDTQSDRARYWLHSVKSFAPDAPVLLVLNQIDQNRNASVDEQDLRGRYDKLTRVVRLSALRFAQDEFNDSFTKVLLEEIQNTGFLDARWPAAWIRVKEKLENMQTHYITGKDYQNICRECGVDENQRQLLHWLSDLGITSCCAGEGDDALVDRVVLRPDWITDALCIILFAGREKAHNGLVPHGTIFNALGNAYRNPLHFAPLSRSRYNARDVGYILGIMRRFQLSFDDGNENEFIPMLCQQNPKVNIQFFRRDVETLELNMEFGYLPNTLLHRLMLERSGELDISSVWYTGARFQREEQGLSAVAAIAGNTLCIYVRYTDPMHRPNAYLTILKSHVDRIVEKMGLEPPRSQLIYKRDGKMEAFDYEALLLSLEHGERYVLSKVFRRKIAIEDILNQAEPDTHGAKELAGHIAAACAMLQTTPLPPREDEINRYLKAHLRGAGYILSDQSLLTASSPGGSYRGEPDLFMMDKWGRPLTVVEAMNIRGGSTMRHWDEHLTKLLHHYNPQGLSPLFLICYVDCEPKAYENLWNRCREHVCRYAPDRSELLYGSCTEEEISRGFLRIVSCRYLINNKEIKVYHYFVRVDTTKPEKSPLPSRKLVERTELSGDAQGAEQPGTVPALPQQTETILRDYRVVFLGDSEAGKTLILSRLDNPEMDPKQFCVDTTIGINIVRRVETINGQPVRLNYWDFGGQDILHSMHRIFLAKNTLYVIVLNTRNDNQDAQAIFWLRYVEAYAPGSPVLLVMNKTDQNKRAALNLPVLQRLFSTRGFAPEDVLKISAVWPEKEKFHKEFTEKLHACIGRYLSASKPFTSQEVRIRDKVEEKKAADKLKVIGIDDFRDICEEESLGDENAQDALMERFNETGVLVYFQSKTVMFMNPEWITKTIYKILDQDEQIADNGVVPYKKIQSFCRKNEDNINKSEDAAYLVDIMRDYDLSFQYEKRKPGEENTEDKEFIPMLCQREEPQDIETLIGKDNTVELRMVFEYLPCGVLYKLMVDCHRELDMDHVWRSGMKLDHENGGYAVVRQEGNTMGLYVHDDRISCAVEWMVRLMEKTEDAARHDKFNATLLETKIGYRIADVLEYFDYQQLKNAEENGVYYTVSRSMPPQKVAIQDILAQKDGTVLEKIKELLKLTSEGCQKLQGRHTFWFLTKAAKDDRLAPKMDEDSRTAELGSVLSSKFTVKDQPRWGDSGGGVKQGELDLWIGLDEHTPLAILEALNISTYENAKSVASWEEHLTRMMCDYNKNGFHNLLLVSYLNCPPEALVKTRKEYFDRMRDYDVPHYGTPKYCEPIVVDEFSDGIQVVRADYSSGAGDVTVYHFLVRIEQYGRKALEKAEKQAK